MDAATDAVVRRATRSEARRQRDMTARRGDGGFLVVDGRRAYVSFSERDRDDYADAVVDPADALQDEAASLAVAAGGSFRPRSRPLNVFAPFARAIVRGEPDQAAQALEAALQGASTPAERKLLGELAEAFAAAALEASFGGQR